MLGKNSVFLASKPKNTAFYLYYWRILFVRGSPPDARLFQWSNAIFAHFRQRKCACQRLDKVNSALSENIRRRGVTLTTTHACLKLRPAGVDSLCALSDDQNALALRINVVDQNNVQVSKAGPLTGLQTAKSSSSRQHYRFAVRTEHDRLRRMQDDSRANRQTAWGR